MKEVPDRTGQVWAWREWLLLIIASPDPKDRYCDTSVREYMHAIVWLEDGHVDGLFERPDNPWEDWDHSFVRIA